MRNLQRNCQPVFYKLYEGEEEILGPWGENTGLYVPKYGELKSAMLCVSPNIGTAETEMFGTLTQYDRTMTTADTTLEIDEDDVLWVDGADTDGPWNYIVKKRAPWKNSIAFAIQEVSVSYYESQQRYIAEQQEKAKATVAKHAEAQNENQPEI